jgi:hypothetical protein
MNLFHSITSQAQAVRFKGTNSRAVDRWITQESVRRAETIWRRGRRVTGEKRTRQREAGDRLGSRTMGCQVFAVPSRLACAEFQISSTLIQADSPILSLT